MDIKIPEPAGNLIRVAGLKGMDSTEHAIATDDSFSKIDNLQQGWSDIES